MPLTNCNSEQMANGADNRAGNCYLLLTNHKQTLIHELHCYMWSIMPSSSLQDNYFCSFQTSADSSAKFICIWQQAVHRLPWTQVTKQWPCIISLYFNTRFWSLCWNTNVNEEWGALTRTVRFFEYATDHWTSQVVELNILQCGICSKMNVCGTMLMCAIK
jgi:hypothetical protein